MHVNSESSMHVHSYPPKIITGEELRVENHKLKLAKGNFEKWQAETLEKDEHNQVRTWEDEEELLFDKIASTDDLLI